MRWWPGLIIQYHFTWEGPRTESKVGGGRACGMPDAHLRRSSADGLAGVLTEAKLSVTPVQRCSDPKQTIGLAMAKPIVTPDLRHRLLAAQRILDSADGVLNFPRGLVDLTLGLELFVAGELAGLFLHFSLDLLSDAFDA